MKQHNHFFLEEHSDTIVSTHHRQPYSLPIQEVRSKVCDTVRDSLERIGVAKYNGCKEDCITNQK